MNKKLITGYYVLLSILLKIIENSPNLYFGKDGGLIAMILTLMSFNILYLLICKQMFSLKNIVIGIFAGVLITFASLLITFSAIVGLSELRKGDNSGWDMSTVALMMIVATISLIFSNIVFRIKFF